MDGAEATHEANQRFMEMIRAADSAAMSSFYTSDAQILPPNGDAVSGADAIAQFWQAFFDLGVAAAQPVTLEVIPMGDYALEGEYSILGEGDSLVDRGKIMVLWKKESGVWKMAPRHLEQQPACSEAAMERTGIEPVTSGLQSPSGLSAR